MMSGTQSRPRKIEIVFLAIILAVGIFLRIPPHVFSEGAPLHSIATLHPQPGFTQIGFDEGLYRQYVNALIENGPASYPDMVEDYIVRQSKLSNAILPPVRFFYIFAAYAWHSLFGCEALDALHRVAAFFSMLTFGLALICTWRMRGSTWGLGVGALMAFAPTQIHMSQHALIDGVFAFWALLCLWLLWENLRQPHDWRWTLGYALALALLVITKENSFFVWVALVALILVNRWLQFGAVTRELLLATIAGPLLGVVILIFLAGGVDNLITTYRLLVTKASQMPYAIHTGDGPWHRYLVDLLLVSPVILILAIGSIFRLDRTKKPELYMSIFITASYLVMCNVRYGMNLRYANMWDMPLRFLAFGSLVTVVDSLRRYRNIALGIAVGVICAIELREYYVFFVKAGLYELVTEGLLRAVHILK
jgi:4-amino-4-deoxy-L-arabinose transferase-like glycosyltransferase